VNARFSDIGPLTGSWGLAAEDGAMPRAAEPGNMLRRYQAGEHEAVWAEMMALGPEVRKASRAEDAWAVARETMRRARHNVELIIRRLDALGYRFWNGEHGERRGPPTKVTFGGKVIEASPLTALLAAMFEDALNRPSSELTPVMIEQLHNIYRMTVYPWQDKSLLMRGQRQPLDARATALFEAAKKLPASALTKELVRELDDARRLAGEALFAMWRQREAARSAEAPAHRPDPLKNKRVFCPPRQKAVALVRQLEAKGIFLPLSLRAWIEEVGHVSLAGAHPRLCFWEDRNFPGVYADPLTVFSEVVLLEMEGWLEERDAGASPGQIDVVIGWDAKAKARLAVADEQLDDGYGIALPDSSADARLKGEPHDLGLVDYLRLAFRWGGFPGWEMQPKRPEKELAVLTEGLLPI
jgi:hypothetical protein